MTLAAAQVVDAVAALLLPQAGLGGRVKTSRAWPWAESDLPACRVFVAGQSVEPSTIDPLDQHTLSIDAQYTTRATADVDDALHALAAAGLTLLFAPPVPHAMRLTGINRTLASQGEAAMGEITLQLQCTVYVDPATPETIHS